MFVQLASLICASCVAGVKFVVEPNGDIIVDIARFNLLGVLLKLNALPTFILVLEANLNALPKVPRQTSLVSISNVCGSKDARKFSASA
uniref:Putative secreted protein n=1 Tax=Panstrongylus lignarius TaxID=156445 RepID=A0A224XVP9_9HEMI